MYYLMHKETHQPVKLVVNSVVPVLSRYEYHFDYELTDVDGMTIFPDKESCISEWSHNNWWELEVCFGGSEKYVKGKHKVPKPPPQPKSPVPRIIPNGRPKGDNNG